MQPDKDGLNYVVQYSLPDGLSAVFPEAITIQFQNGEKYHYERDNYLFIPSDKNGKNEEREAGFMMRYRTLGEVLSESDPDLPEGDY